MAVSSSMETSTSQDEHLHRQTLPSQDLPLTSNHQQMKGPDTLVEGQAVKGFCVAKDVYRRGKQLIPLVPVILDSRPAVPFTPDPEGMQALILGGFLTDGDMSKPGKVLSVVKVRRIEVHDSNITCAMFDVRKIVTGSLDMTVRVHDMRSGREVSVLADHKGGVRCLQYDDAILVTGSWDTSCVVWDLIQGSKLAELNGHKDGVSSLKLTEKYIVTGSVDCTVRVWHRTTFHCVHHLRAHRGPVTCLVLEEGQLMSGSADSAVLIWDVDSGDCVGELAHPSALVAMERSKLLLVTATVRGEIQAWNLSSHTRVTSWSLYSTGASPHTDITALCLIKAHLVVGASDGCLYEWDLTTGSCVRFLRGHSLAVTSIQSGHNRFVTSSSDMTVCVWHTKEGEKSGGPFFVRGEENQFSHVPIKIVTL